MSKVQIKAKSKKISTILPRDLLAEATRLAESNQTDTIIAGLHELIRSFKRRSLSHIKGKLHIDFDVQQDRERLRF